MIEFQKLESSVAALEKQLQEVNQQLQNVKDQIADVRHAYLEESCPGKKDMREYLLEKANERFGKYYLTIDKDEDLFEGFSDVVKRKVKKSSIVTGYAKGDTGIVFCDDAFYVFKLYTPYVMEFMMKYDAMEDLDFVKITGRGTLIQFIVKEGASEKNGMVKKYSNSKFDIFVSGRDGDLSDVYKFFLDILEFINS